MIEEKRPVVKEELVIGKRVVEERDVVEEEVRREKFDIDDRSTTPSGERIRGEGSGRSISSFGWGSKYPWLVRYAIPCTRA